MKFEKYPYSEERFQIALARYLDVLNVAWYHVPNEIKAKKQYYKKRKKLGVKKGIPDICIIEPNKYYKGLYIELKVGYNQPSEEQMQWIDKLKNRGYLSFVSYSLDECIYVIEEYLKDSRFELKSNCKVKYHNYLLKQKSHD